jgi:hypothetical protein
VTCDWTNQSKWYSIGPPPRSPIKPPQQALAPQGNPFTSTAGGQGNLFHAPQSNNPRPPSTQADRAALLIALQKYPQQPDTEPGRQAHQAQQTEWVKTHGFNGLVTDSTPYPLRPGTLPVGSGECFTCGFTGHMGRRDGSTCGGNRALNPREQMWRAICSRILRQTHVAASVQLVEVDDYGTTWQDIQGKEEGSSN